MTITLAEEMHQQMQEEREGFLDSLQATPPKRGRGALKKADPTIWEKVGLSESEWARAQIYFPGGGPTSVVREMLDTCKKFRTEGREVKAGKAPGARLSAAVGRAAAARGMERAAYINAACAAFEAAQEGREETR